LEGQAENRRKPMARINVIIPAYNVAHYLPEAIESVLGQTYSDLDVTVIDDGSTDNTTEVVVPYLDRIAFLKVPNGGPARARNLAIQKSSEEYLAFLDADDVWYPDKLERQLDVFERNPDYHLVYSDALVTTADSSQKDRLWSSEKRQMKEGWVFDDLLAECFIMIPSVIVKRDCLEQVGLFDEDLVCWEGYDLWLRVSHRYPIGFVNAPLLERRLHTSNFFYSNPRNDIVSLINIMQKWEKATSSLSEGNRAIINKNLADNFFRLGRYYVAQGSAVEARTALRDAFSREFSLRSLIYLALSALPPSVLEGLRKAKRRVGFRRTRTDRI